jgi:uncharacterized protein YjbI with pentapeptide repeats
MEELRIRLPRKPLPQDEAVPESEVALPESSSPLEEIGSMSEVIADVEELKAARLQKQPQGAIVPGQIPPADLAEILIEHRDWLESGGTLGARANLSGADLEGAELTGASLQGASLHKVNLQGADLSLANLEGASLIEADLRRANLLGAELRGANLMGANLQDAQGLWVGRLAGTNLFGAILPDSASSFDGPKAVGQVMKVARWFYFAMLLLNLLDCLVVIFTTDVQLLTNSPVLPIPRVGAFLPTGGFYLGGPLLLFCSYLGFHFLLLRLWGSVAALPAVFPDGRTLEKSGPWFLVGLVRGHLRWLREAPSPLSALERSVSALLAYWLVPATLLLFWARYLTRQDLRGTLLHVALVVAAVLVGAFLPSFVARVVRPEDLQPRKSKRAVRVVSLGAALALGCVLALLSVGVIRGLPQDASRVPDRASTDVRRWAAEVLWLVGYDPHVDLTESDVSIRPATGNGAAENVALVRGARLNQLNLRFARAYRAFLVNAHLWGANLEGAQLSEADLRGANLREAKLRWAWLDRARANRAILIQADARNASFTAADLEDADLSYALLDDAALAQARLAGASLYGASLRRAQLPRADLQRADLREANLENAVLTFADLRQADLWSAKLPGARLNEARLTGAILLEADLRGADLRGADLQGAIVRGALMGGANLEGDDLRGAVGLTAAQVCSFASRRSAQLQPDLQQAADALCGPPR